MTYTLMIMVFVLGYVAIGMEHVIKIDKAATALFIAVIIWSLFILGGNNLHLSAMESTHHIENSLMHHLGEISGILFFLLGAMTLVELIDLHHGFDLITDKITSTSKRKLLWSLCIFTFFMSAVLDNLTTSIIMAALLKKLIANKKDLWLFASMIIIAANTGGAWSPIGDVTTIMLWIGGQITAGNVITKLFLPSLICMLVPLSLISLKIKGSIAFPDKKMDGETIPEWDKKMVMYVGVGALIFVPIFKNVTHLPPFMGVLLGLSVLWIFTEIIHKKKPEDLKKNHSITAALRNVDTSSILFFLGILLSVAALQTSGQLAQLSLFLDQKIGNIWVINYLIGIFSSIVDNVPLVAGSIGMYSLENYPQDHTFWELLTYCAGTGGSILIIGSAAGVAIMGILKIDFIWYLKNISIYALIGYTAGILLFFAMDLMA